LTGPILAASLILLSGCGGGSGDSAGADSGWTVALVLPGQINDRGWNEIGYQGLLRIRDELGARVLYSEDTKMVNWDRVIRGFIADGADIVLLHGLEFEDIGRRFAEENPDVYFLVSNAVQMAGPNLSSVGLRTQEAAFLTGVVGGLMTETGKTGAIVGFEYPLMIGQAEAFRLGVRSVNPDASSESVVIGTLFDPVIGKEAARAMIEREIDVIWQLANSAGLGVLQAAEEGGVNVIGWGIDQRPLAPRAVITTMKVDAGACFVVAVRDIFNGTFAPEGNAYEFGVETEYTGLGPFHERVAQSVRDEAERWRRAIAEGAVTVPARMPMDRSQEIDPLSLPEGY
jgi:basic membrane protein A